jgi:hypothetical protein
MNYTPEREKGGEGSGNWGHAGRPGLEGGSAPSDSVASGSYRGSPLGDVSRRPPDKKDTLHYEKFYEFVSKGVHIAGRLVHERRAVLEIATAANIPDVNRAIVHTVPDLWSSTYTRFAMVEMEKVASDIFGLTRCRGTRDLYAFFANARDQWIVPRVTKGPLRLKVGGNKNAITLRSLYLIAPYETIDSLMACKTQPGAKPSPETEALIRQHLELQYERTQRMLREEGVEFVTVYVPFKVGPSKVAVETSTGEHLRSPVDDFLGSDVTMENFPSLVSCTWDRATAFGVDKTGTAYNAGNILIRVTVPRDRVFALNRTGMGDTSTKEVIIIGGAKPFGVGSVVATPASWSTLQGAPRPRPGRPPSEEHRDLKELLNAVLYTRSQYRKRMHGKD